MAVPSHPLPGDRLALRRQARERRRTFVAGLDGAERLALEAQLADLLDPFIANSRIVGAYAPLPDEISPAAAVARARAAGKTVAFPAFADHLGPFRYLAGAPTEAGPFGIDQPSLAASEVHPDLVLVPLVAIDGNGNRLGHGKGHYDRVLPELKRRGALVLGLGWPVQKLDHPFEAEAWDVAMDGFASPAGVEMVR